MTASNENPEIKSGLRPYSLYLFDKTVLKLSVAGSLLSSPILFPCTADTDKTRQYCIVSVGGVNWALQTSINHFCRKSCGERSFWRSNFNRQTAGTSNCCRQSVSWDNWRHVWRHYVVYDVMHDTLSFSAQSLWNPMTSTYHISHIVSSQHL